MQTALKRDEELNRDEIAFYDALAERPEVLQTMSDANAQEPGHGANREAPRQHHRGLAGTR
jgi:hypothetical protein